MWWLFIYNSIFMAMPSVNLPFNSNSIEIIFNNFLLLGIIPGTQLAITFDWFLIGAWFVFFAWLATKAFPEAFNILQTQKNITKKLREIDIFSL